MLSRLRNLLLPLLIFLSSVELQGNAHSISDDITAELSGRNPFVAGLGAMAGEFGGELFFDWVKSGSNDKQRLARKEKAIEVTQFMIGLGAFLSGQKAQDIQMAAQTGGTAMRHNALVDVWLLEKYQEYEFQLKKLAEALREGRAPRGESYALEDIGSSIQQTSEQYWRNGEITPEAQQMMRFDPMGSVETTVALILLFQSGGHCLSRLGDGIEQRRHYYDQPLNHTTGTNRFIPGTIAIPMAFEALDFLSASLSFFAESSLLKMGVRQSIAQDIGDVADFIPMIATGFGAVARIGNIARVGRVMSRSSVLGETTSLVPVTSVSQRRAVQVRTNYANGRSFQNGVHEFTGIPENRLGYQVLLDNNKLITTIPDFPIMYGITDIKNVRYISMKDQLRAQIMLAQNEVTSFNLIISPQTERISKKVWESIEESKIRGKVLEFNPQTQTLIERIVENGKVVRN